VRHPSVFEPALRFLNSSGATYVLVGGIPAGILGEPRFTDDVDALVFLPTDDVDTFLRSARRSKAKGLGRNASAKIRKHRFLRLWIGGDQLDVLVASSLHEFEMMTRRRWVDWGGVSVAIPSPEDMILLKLMSGRVQDWLDAKAIQIRHGSKLDKDYLESWARRLKVQRGRGRVIARLTRLFRMRYRE